MRPAKLGELAAIALIATICLSYGVMARAQPALDPGGTSVTKNTAPPASG